MSLLRSTLLFLLLFSGAVTARERYGLYEGNRSQIHARKAALLDYYRQYAATTKEHEAPLEEEDEDLEEEDELL